MSENEIPRSRKSYLLRMAAQVAVQQGKKILQADPETRLQTLLEQAHVVVNHVGKLKGAAMKAIQSLSIEGADFIPPEVIQVLEKLQSQAPPIKSEVLMDQLKKELGEEKFSLLKHISEKPIASASIGQVYKAQFNDQDVVVKIQYPGVAESVDEDIDTLSTLLKGLLVVSGKKVRFGELMEEVRRVLKMETDYLHEMENLIRYKKGFDGSEYIIPDVFPEMTTSKVLTMSYQEGLEYTEWLKTNPTDDQRKAVAKQLLSLYNKEFFENRLVQTDPNPANFLINKDNKMVILDFGATLEFDLEFVKEYQTLVRTVFSEDRDKILEQVYTMNFLDSREDKECQDMFIDFLLLSMTPFDLKHQPFDFGDSEYSQTVRTEAMKFSRKLVYSAPPKKLIFLHRKLGGIFMLVKKMNIKADLTEFREIMLDKDFF